MVKKDKKTRVKKEYYIDDGEEDLGYSNVPQMKIDLKVLAEGNGHCLLKDDGNKNIYSVEKSIYDGKVFLNLLVKGRG